MRKDNSCSQIRIITRITAIACLTSMLLCYKLWLGERVFPTSPVFNHLLKLNHPFDIIIFCITGILLLCICIVRNPQKFIISFLVCAAILAILDQNRWQPWFYQYMMMFFIVSFFNFRCDDTRHQHAITTILKLMIGAIYFWSGLQKLNPHFLSETFPWLMEPITKHLGEGAIKDLNWVGKSFPIIETLTGIVLFISPVKKMAVILIFLMHIFILFVLGPFGQNYNPVVWPWNVAMMLFSFILFFNNEIVIYNQIKEMLRYHSIKIVSVLFILMPLFNFFDLWDSYLSHNLYSGNTSNGIIYVSENLQTRLPEAIQPFSIGESDQKRINIKYWCMQELGVPAYPEKRNFKAISRSFYNYATDSSDVYFMYVPKLKLINL